MTPTQELTQINTLIENAKRDFRNGRYEARDTIKQLEKLRTAANDRCVDEIVATVAARSL